MRKESSTYLRIEGKRESGEGAGEEGKRGSEIPLYKSEEVDIAKFNDVSE